jgi:hypothetical protein
MSTKKTAQEIAQATPDPQRATNRKTNNTPPGVAQSVILDALNIQADNFIHANVIFKALGITVIPKRVGRSSVPVVSLLDSSGGGIDIYGDGDAWDDTSPDVDLSAISEWMEDN